jgi:hypothetical protein
MHMPILWYFVDWNRSAGLYIAGILGVLVCLAACAACWYQIINDPSS